MSRTISRIPCPAIRRGPVTAPRRGLSLIVAESSGPGMRAPENAIKKEETKIATI
jgi:hypothetical protein